MSAITARLTEVTELAKPDDRAVEGLHGLGAFAGLIEELPALGVAHAGLTRTMWIRRVLENFLSQRRYTIEQGRSGDNAGQLVFRLDQPMPKNVIPWMTATRDWDEFGLWGESGKMGCPTWDLPAGGVSAGGACPGADAGQTIVDPRTRLAHLAREGGKFVIPNAPPGGERIAFREGESICQNCITGDALVLVRGEGLVPIAQLANRGRIVVWSGKAWRETEAVFNGVKPTVLVSMYDGRTLRCTEDHGFIATDNTRVPAIELENNEALPWELPDEAAFPALAMLPLVTLETMYRTEKRGELPTSWSRELGVWLGYVVGDGWMTEDKYSTIGICASEHDRADLDKIVVFINQWTGSEAEVVIGGPTAPSAFAPDGGKPMAKVMWRQKSAVALARSLGLRKLGEHTHTPAAVWNASRDGVAGYLSGLFSTDGSVGARGAGIEVSFANTSKRLVGEVRQLLFAFGIKTSFCEYTSNRERGYLPLWKVAITCRESILRFRDRVGFFNARKAAKLNGFLADPNFSRTERKSNAHVASVIPTGKEEPVFDLINVGPEHQFTANGISVSNCYALEGNYPSPHVQCAEILRYWWLRGMIEQRRVPELVSSIVMSMQLIRYPTTPQGILPVRIHSAGDFFSQKYADVWIEVANRMWALDKRVTMWAPTRTWAAGNWPDYWAQALERLESTRQGAKPNLVVRPSAYHFNDRAPERLHPLNARGTTSLILKDTEGAKSVGDGGDFRSQDSRTDWHCPAYSVVEDDHTCSNATNERGSTHCRYCWVHPEKRVNYFAH